MGLECCNSCGANRQQNVPKMDTKSWGLLMLILNIFFPGIGSIIAGLKGQWRLRIHATPRTHTRPPLRILPFPPALNSALRTCYCALCVIMRWETQRLLVPTLRRRLFAGLSRSWGQSLEAECLTCSPCAGDKTSTMIIGVLQFCTSWLLIGWLWRYDTHTSLNFHSHSY